MAKIKMKIRPQRVSDAKRFFDILNSDKFHYFGYRPKSLEEEIEYLKSMPERRRKNLQHNYTVVYDGKVVGAIGIKVRQHDRSYIGEIGYFLDENYWGRGIATKAVKQMEKIGFTKFKLRRIEIWVHPKNKGSIKVAEKAGYKREGLMRKVVRTRLSKDFEDAYLYAKVK
ncbi:GNAT family N-acetyltransferase [Candidatus Woesearchaeota archaeon]|nr:GNAT family N-acetyltransferase [Candidatus Woesearchaeota archaeon]